jgi:hypothetical protein
MDLAFWMLLALAATMLCATLNARRIGNEGRDVVLMAVITGVLGLGSVAAAIF